MSRSHLFPNRLPAREPSYCRMIMRPARPSQSTGSAIGCAVAAPSVAGDDHHAAAAAVIAVVAVVGAVVIAVDGAFQHVVVALVAALAVLADFRVIGGPLQRAVLLAREIAVRAVAGGALPGGDRRAGARAEDADRRRDVPAL